MLATPISIDDFNGYSYYRQVPALYRRADGFQGRPLPCFGGTGTGGIEDVQFVLSRQGYSPIAILRIKPRTTQEIFAPFTDLMMQVKAGFGRNITHLPAVFGVSRQTLYNWINGEIPKQQHQEKIEQLAIAAQVFTNAGFKPNPLSLNRIVNHGKSFLELIEQGGNGKATAERLIRIEKRGVIAREKLNALLGNRSLSISDDADMGHFDFHENV